MAYDYPNECVVCGALPHAACTTKGGKKTDAHMRRVNGETPTRYNRVQTRKEFDQPMAVSGAQRAFPASVVGTYLPPREWFEVDAVPRAWEDFADAIFFGKGLSDIALLPKEGIDAQAAWDHATMILGSFEPKHEHKMEGVAWLLWHWFEGGEYKVKRGDNTVTKTLAQSGNR